MASKLNDRQIKFVHYLMEGLTDHEAYCRAYGYEYDKLTAKQRKNIRARACAAKKSRNISQLLEERQAEWAAASDVRKEQIIALLAKVISGESIADRTVITDSDLNGKSTATHSISKQWAIEKLCKILGFNEPEKHEVTVEAAANRAELEQELKRLESLTS